MRKVSFVTIFIIFYSSLYALELQSTRQRSKHQLDTAAKQERRIDEQEVYDGLQQFPNNQPSFGIYRDNYFITGVPTNQKINKYTADAKFQISFRQILFKSILPKNNLLALTYTQKSFWNIY